MAIATTEPRLNKNIRVNSCRLIDADGTQLGIFGLNAALNIADEQGLDLVEIAPGAEPPVCRVMDYSKYRYEQTQKAKLARKKQARVEVKEMKFRPKIDVGDYETKKRHILRFLDSGAKVKVTIMFRGRELAHTERGLTILDRLAVDLKDVANIENQPKLEGRNMHMLIAPLKKSEEKNGRKASRSIAADDKTTGVFESDSAARTTSKLTETESLEAARKKTKAAAV